jgi:hypothetical protein
LFTQQLSARAVTVDHLELLRLALTATHHLLARFRLLAAAAAAAALLPLLAVRAAQAAAAQILAALAADAL